jgi:hypothetical protein
MFLFWFPIRSLPNFFINRSLHEKLIVLDHFSFQLSNNLIESHKINMRFLEMEVLKEGSLEFNNCNKY